MGALGTVEEGGREQGLSVVIPLGFGQDGCEQVFFFLLLPFFLFFSFFFSAVAFRAFIVVRFQVVKNAR